MRLGAYAAILALSVAATGAEPWTQWKGPRRDGTSAEASGHPEGWPPKKLWSAEIGPGGGGAVFDGERLFVMGHRNRREILYCFDADSGRTLYEQSYPAPTHARNARGDKGAYAGPLATPTLDAQTERVYTLGVDGELRCWKTRPPGKLIWRKNLYEAYRIRRRPGAGGGVRDFGTTTSPLLLGGNVLVEAGRPAGVLVALDKNTGEETWSARHTGPAGHTCGPTPIDAGDREAVALLSLDRLLVIDAADKAAGTTLAGAKWVTKFACNIPTPAVADDRVVVTSAYNRKRTTLFRFTGSDLREVWTSREYAIVSAPTIAFGRVFLIHKRLVCLDLESGKTLWKGGRFGKGSCIATADGKLIVFGNNTLALIDARSERYKELAKIEGVGRSDGYPQLAFSGGRIACRDRRGTLVVFSTK